MKRVSTKDAAAALGISGRRLRALCAEGRVRGAELIGEGARAVWVVPVGDDGRPRVEDTGTRGPAPTYLPKK